MPEQAKNLAASELGTALKDLSGWSITEGKLHREYQFANFAEAFGFMTSAALVAESMNHHPEWCNVYNKVVVDLKTHSTGGISNLDVELASRMEVFATRAKK